MKTLIYIILGLNIVIFSAVVYLFVENSNDKEKIAYFLSGDVYNTFDYKIELEQELEGQQKRNKTILDSLEVDYKMMIGSLVGEPTEDQIILLKRKQEIFLELKEKFEITNSEAVKKSYDQIWGRINEYVQKYGKDNGYVYIFGANGDGSIMYADKSNDITKEIKTYVNQKYSGQ